MDQQSEERRCVELDGRKACVSLENDFWDCIEQIATLRGITFDRLVAQIVGDTAKDDLPAVLRVFVLGHYRQHFGQPMHEVSNAAVSEESPPFVISEVRYLH